MKVTGMASSIHRDNLFREMKILFKCASSLQKFDSNLPSDFQKVPSNSMVPKMAVSKQNENKYKIIKQKGSTKKLIKILP